MTVYLDTSDLIKLYVQEAGSDRIQRLVTEADGVVTSALTYTEARATFARRRRERLLTRPEASRVIAQFDIDWPRYIIVPFSEDLARQAGRLADAHGLRGGDAVHLASFEVLVVGCEDDEVRFSSADDRLSKAARTLG